MANDPREIRRKLRILEHAEASGDVSKTCRYFGSGARPEGDATVRGASTSMQMESSAHRCST